MTSTPTVVEAVHKTVTVACPVEQAFRTFTEEIGSWWPLHTHSISVMDDGSGAPQTAIMELHAGGRLYERRADGRECEWGSVVAWEPPSRLVLSWHPGYEAERSTEIEVRFSPEAGGTRVELEHRNWERLGDRAAPTRSGYDDGWTRVLGRYADAAGAPTAGSSR